MTAATASRVADGRIYTGKSNLPFPLTASEHVYRGTLAVILTSTGLVVDWDDAQAESAIVFVGVHLREVYNLASATANIKDDKCPVARDGTIVLIFNGTTEQKDVGKKVYGIDNQTCQLTTGSDELYIGKIIRYISATSVEVELDTYAT